MSFGPQATSPHRKQSLRAQTVWGFTEFRPKVNGVEPTKSLLADQNLALTVLYVPYSLGEGNLDGGVAEHVVVVVVEGLRRRDDDRLARVDPEGVEVLHVAHCDAVAIRVANNLILDLLPAALRLLDQHLPVAHFGQ